MTQTAKYFYKCDNCGLAYEVEYAYREADKVERQILSDGWVFLRDFSVTMLTKKERHISGCMPIYKGEYCSIKCLKIALARSIDKRLKE